MMEQPTAQDYDQFVEWASVNRTHLNLTFCTNDHANGFYAIKTQMAFGYWWAGRCSWDVGHLTPAGMAITMCNSVKQYNAHSASSGVVEKTFNHGTGSLCCFRFMGGKEIKVNPDMFSDTDLQNIKKVLGFDPEIVESVEIGYPKWYGRSL